MTMPKLLLSGFLGMCVSLAGGCSVDLVRPANPAKELAGVCRSDLNDGPIKIERSEDDPNTFIISFIDSAMALSKPCRVDYVDFYFDLTHQIAVRGTMANGKEYPVLVDTGFPGGVLTNDLTVLDSNLCIVPFGKDTFNGWQTGFCHIPLLKIGEITLKNPLAEYIQQHWQFKVLGIPLWRQKGLLIGMAIIRQYGYLLFDNVEREVEFSPSGPFEPENVSEWDSYPIDVNERSNRLNVRLPIQGHDYRLMFDTCGHHGMVALPDLWSVLSDNLGDVKVKESSYYSGFHGKMGGGHKAAVRNLEVANLKVKKADILILPEDNKFTNCSYISMKYFKKTSVALDFQNGLMWVKKPER
jgi:hypothetical protein